MKRLLIPLLSAISLQIAVNANVDPEVHKICLSAKDYRGCVQFHSGQNSITVDQGLSKIVGNACPNGFAYVGGGTCRSVGCEFKGAFNSKDNPQLAGKQWRCKKGLYPEALGYKDATVRAFNNPKCPEYEPELGWQDTCKQNAGEEILGSELMR